MKYLKLFENWLNEAEGEVKPFDPKNPGASLVVDITAGDMFKDDQTAATTLESILNRAIAKQDSPEAPKAVKVERFQFEFEGDLEKMKSSMKENKYGLPITNLDTNKKYFIQLFDLDSDTRGNFEKLIAQNQTLLMVSPASGEYSSESKREALKSRPVIELSNDVFILGCDLNAKTWNGYTSSVGEGTSVLDAKKKTNFILLTGGTISANDCNLIGLFQIMSDSAVRKTAISKLSFKTYPTGDFNMEKVAKTLGYKIPKDYSSKQGGIELKKA